MQFNRVTKFNWLTAGNAPLRVFYGGGKSQTSTSQVSIPPEVLSQYENVNSIANQVATTPFTQYSTDPNAFVAPLDATQQAGILGTNQYSSAAQPFYQQASNLNSPSGVASYYNPEASQVGALMQQQFNQAQSGQLGNAINQGAFGGDRSAITAANLQQQQGLAYGNAMAGIYNNAVTNSQNAANLEGNLGAGAQQAGLAGAQAQLTAGQAQQQTEQAGETALYNQFLQQQSYPFQTTQFLGNIAEGTGSLSGSTTTSNQPAPFFSDERLKDDIEPIGKTFDGLNIIKFRYKGDKQKQIGLSAQDVEKKHPESVGLAGGYKTVDYDAATKRAAGLAGKGAGTEIRAGRHDRADGGGFALDPSYLEAQQQAYASAPWGNAGVGVGLSPYGGKSHVPPSTGGGHAQLAVAKAPAMSSSGGLGDLTKNLGTLESLGKEGKSLWNDAKDSGLAGKLGLGTPPVGAPAPAQPASAPPLANQPQPAGGGPVATPVPTPDPMAGRATLEQRASLDGGLDPSMGSDADIADSLGDIFASRGGLMHRDQGGATYQDATADDQSDGGDVPYDSGTGMKGLNVPDDKPHNTLATAQNNSSSRSSDGGFNPLSLVTGALGLFGLANGGRVGLAGGGDPGDIPLPDLDNAASIGQGAAPPDQAAILAKHATPEIVVAPPTRARSAPKGGLNPNAPSPDAQPVQNQQQMIDMGAGSGAPMHQTQPGEVLTQDNPGGVGDFLNKNQGLLVPLLHGLGTMASSNSRYLGSAILQGLGGAADSYENVQNEMQDRLGGQSEVQMRQNNAGNSDLDYYQSAIAQRPELANLTFAQFQALKASGRLNSYQGKPQSAPNVAPGNPNGYSYTVHEKNTGVNAQGVPLYLDPAYNAGFSAHYNGTKAPFLQGQVHQSNDQAAATNAQQFTYDKDGNQVTLPGMNSRVMAQNQPTQQVAAANDFMEGYKNNVQNNQNSMSLLNEMDKLYQGFKAGPTAAWTAQAQKLIQDLDPNGTILGHTSAGEDNDKIMKDIGQLTKSQLSTMAQGAPKDAHDLLNSFAPTPDKSPGAIRDMIIRQKAGLQQMNDYYSGFDPYKDPQNRSVFDYQKQFYAANPYEKYRQQLEKSTPAYAGQGKTGGNGGNAGGSTQQGLPTFNSPSDIPKDFHGTFMTPDGRRKVVP